MGQSEIYSHYEYLIMKNGTHRAMRALPSYNEIECHMTPVLALRLHDRN